MGGVHILLNVINVWNKRRGYFSTPDKQGSGIKRVVDKLFPTHDKARVCYLIKKTFSPPHFQQTIYRSIFAPHILSKYKKHTFLKKGDTPYQFLKSNSAKFANFDQELLSTSTPNFSFML